METEIERLQGLALDTTKKRLNGWWSSTLRGSSSLSNGLSAKLDQSNEQILDYVTSLTPSMHEKVEKEGID